MRAIPVKSLDQPIEDDIRVLDGLSSEVGNRTHRLVRDRARKLQARRVLVRALWIPLTLSSSFFLVLCIAAWCLMDDYEPVTAGVPEAGRLFFMALWSLPLSAGMLAWVWFRREPSLREGEESR